MEKESVWVIMELLQSVTRVLQECYKVSARVLQGECAYDGERKCLGHHGTLAKCYKGFTRVLQGECAYQDGEERSLWIIVELLHFLVPGDLREVLCIILSWWFVVLCDAILML
jgi:hypothetical protein